MRLPTSVLLISLAACGGSSKPAATGPANAGGDGDTAAAPAVGTTGLPGLDWGASAEAVLAANPRATASPNGATVTAVAPVDGKNAITVYELSATGLAMITTEWTDGFVSMDDCAGGWKDARAALDARYFANGLAKPSSPPPRSGIAWRLVSVTARRPSRSTDSARLCAR